jgi:hypothetical protein
MERFPCAYGAGLQRDVFFRKTGARFSFTLWEPSVLLTVSRRTPLKGILLVSTAVISPAQSFISGRQGFAIRSVAMALVMLLHLGLILFLMRPPIPWFFRPLRLDARESDLHIELLPHLRRVTVSRIIEKVAMHVQPIRHMTASHASRLPTATVNPVPDTPPVTESAPIAPVPDVPYGNSPFARAVDDARSSGLPQIPGDNLVAFVPGIHVVSPPSIKNRLRDAGTLLRCKDALFKGRMSDEELLKRGLTKQQMDQEFIALGCH